MAVPLPALLSLFPATLSVLFPRHLRADRLCAGGCRGKPGQCPGHLPAKPALPADPAHAADGPKGWHLEAPGLGHLRPQQSKFQGEATRFHGLLTHLRLSMTSSPLQCPQGVGHSVTMDDDDREHEGHVQMWSREAGRPGLRSQLLHMRMTLATSLTPLWPSVSPFPMPVLQTFEKERGTHIGQMW